MTEQSAVVDVSGCVAKYESVAAGTLRFSIDIFHAETDRVMRGMARAGVRVVLSASRTPDKIAVGTVRRFMSLADGTLRLFIDVDSAHEELARVHIAIVGSVVMLIRLSDHAAVGDEAPPRADFGQFAKDLRLSPFFRSPLVWALCGNQTNYVDHLLTLKCCLGPDGCSDEGRPRRAQTLAAALPGVTDFLDLSLCEHHSRFEGAVLMNARTQCAQEWSWAHLKKLLGFESWRDCPPGVLVSWATRHRVSHLLPASIKKFAA